MDFREYAEKFKSFGEDFPTFLHKFVIKQSLLLLAKTKQRTPVDTGLLRNSWSVGANGTTITIANDRDYASFIEYGTPARKKWKWAGGAHMMQLSIEEIQAQMPKLFDEALEQYWKSKGL